MLVHFPKISPLGFRRVLHSPIPSTTFAAVCSLSCWQPYHLNQEQERSLPVQAYPLNPGYYTTHFRRPSYDKYDCECLVERLENLWSIDGLFDTCNYDDV
jgi:hypothetical protein